MGGGTTPKVEVAASPAPAPQAAEAPKNAEQEAALAKTKANAEAAKESQKSSARDSLAALRATIKAPEMAAGETKQSLLNEVVPKVPEFMTSFTKYTQAAFVESIRAKALEGLSAESDAAKKEKLANVFADAVVEDFIGKFINDYYALLADGVAGNIALDVTVNAGKVIIAAKNQGEVDGAKKIAEDKAKEAAANLDQPAEIQRFQKEHPEAFLFLSQTFFKNPEEMKAAFAGKGLIGFFLGMLGYGAGKTVYSSIMKSEWFSKYRNSILDSLAKLDESLDFHDPIELAKASDLDAYYKNIPQNELRTITRKFVVNAEITLPEVTTFGSVVFPKGAGNVSLAGASKEGSPLATSFKRDEKYKNITVPKDTKIEAGTVFYGLTIGDKAKIEAALKGAPQATPVVDASAPKPAVDASASAPTPPASAPTPSPAAAK